MKAFLRITLLIIAVFAIGNAVMAQRVIKGTVYSDGKPAAGITVEAHKGGSMMTSFDGMYEIEADAKTKWIKFTFIDETKRLEIEDKPGDVFDFAFTGSIPSGDDTEDKSDGSVNMKSAEELVGAGDKDFMNLWSLYREFYNQKDYNSALPHWKKMYSTYPKASPNIYIHGAKMHETFMEKAGSKAEKDKLFDDYMKVYDNRMKYFGQKGYVMGRKGTAWLKYKMADESLEGEAKTNALKSGYEWLKVSVEEQGEETEIPVLVLLMQTSSSLFKLGALPKETVVVNYDNCNSILNKIIEKGGEDQDLEMAQKAQPILESIFGKSGAADCDALANIFTPQFAEKGDDIDFIKNMLRRLRRAKCDDSELVEQATEKLYDLEPSAEAAFNMARRYVKRDDIVKAKEYYKQAMDQETDKELLATYYYEYAYFIFAKESALSEARSYARKALAENPDYCEANILIGDIYVAASRSFEGSNLQKAAVFWVAVDYFNKARIDQECAIDAAQKAATYKKYFPNKEDAFMEGLESGKTYKVEGWINENTKVRF